MISSFYTDVIQKDRRFRSTARVDDLTLLEPFTMARVMAILAAAQARGVRLRVHETFRSRARQQELYDRGTTKLRNVGVHHYGLAADIVLTTPKGGPTWAGDFTVVGELAHEFGLVWGGDWGAPTHKNRFVDKPHVQRCTLARQKDLFAGSWYPDPCYDPYRDGAQHPAGQVMAGTGAPISPGDR